MKQADELREKLINLAVSMIKLGQATPKTAEGRMVIAQLIRSGSATAIAYCRGQVSLVNEDPGCDTSRVIELLDKVETLIGDLVQDKMMGIARSKSGDEKSKRVQYLLETEVKNAMEQLCERRWN